MIITFANQKGGVGKSTLAALFAHFMVENGYKVLVVDADGQRSISDKRREDISLFGEEEMKYAVDAASLDSIQASEKLMNALIKYTSAYKDRIIIIDLPGNVTDNYLAPILVQSNYILCPFFYSNLEVKSTFAFAKVINRLKDMFNSKVKMIFIPNKIEKSIGTREEQKEKINNNECLSALGELTPEILKRAELSRFNTAVLKKKQRKAISPAFEFILSIIQ